MPQIKLSEELQTYKFTDEFIIDVLEWAKNNKRTTRYTKAKKKKMASNLLEMVDSKRLTKLNDLILSLSKCEEIEKVYEYYVHFSNNYSKILSGALSIKFQLSRKTIDEIKPFFEYAYKDLIERKTFWTIYNENKVFFKKKELRRLLSKKYKVCPYCDLVDINESISSNMDHFLPFSEFPVLSVFWSNIICACSICNGHQIKNNVWKLPILHPYFDDLNNGIKFVFDDINKKIKVISKNKHAKESNFIKTIKKNERYEDLWEYVEKEHRDLINLVIEYEKDEKDTSWGVEFIKEIIENRKDFHLSRIGKITHSRMHMNYCDHFVSKQGDSLTEFIERESIKKKIAISQNKKRINEKIRTS
ncbi:hypothetical protein [Paenibacillus sp. DR312]|uniref:hypothetical protein n=1 Tax=unclassified Paenibacillus TaxID=185978 RepID=UPI001C93D2FC|nr:hypothetical protein [Paenibacillus sp. DR312]QZN78509.1 hypothetical protein K5K90_15790 [Paenibacillus sp. DR312]